jgi:ribonuclease HI
MVDVTIYTDGVCPDNRGLGGWGVVMLAGEHVRELCGGEQGATTNRMELQAAISALNALKRPSTVELCTDSTYVIEGMETYLSAWKSRGWKTASREPVKNDDLWRVLDAIAEIHDIRWKWVKAGQSEHNRHANALANQGFKDLLAQANAVTQAHAEEAREERLEQREPVNVARQVTIYTDGSCLGNPGPGGWAAIIQGGGITTELSGGMNDTTNNRMELTAALEGLESTDASRVRLVTDSQYVIKGIEEWMPNWQRNNWRTQGNTPVKNADLWRRMAMAIKSVDLKLEWVKGHSGHPMNERCDSLAQEQARLIQSAQKETRPQHAI